jgi:hypothetical protein
MPAQTKSDESGSLRECTAHEQGPLRAIGPSQELSTNEWRHGSKSWGAFAE